MIFVSEWKNKKHVNKAYEHGRRNAKGNYGHVSVGDRTTLQFKSGALKWNAAFHLSPHGSENGSWPINTPRWLHATNTRALTMKRMQKHAGTDQTRSWTQNPNCSSCSSQNFQVMNKYHRIAQTAYHCTRPCTYINNLNSIHPNSYSHAWIEQDKIHTSILKSQ